MHTFFKDAEVSTAVPGVAGNLNGKFKVAANALSMQYTVGL